MLLRNAVYLLLAMLFFATIHSLTAGGFLKNLLASMLGESAASGWYRLTYNLLSVLTLLPVAALLLWLPDNVIYQTESPLSTILRIIQALSIGGVLISLFTTDLGRFVGLSQGMGHLMGQPPEVSPGELTVTGLYRYVRHPLYFFSLTLLWFSPRLTWNGLIFNVAATLYFVIGSLIEEKRLEKRFGAAYRTYRKMVPWLLPIRLPLNLPKDSGDQGTL